MPALREVLALARGRRAARVGGYGEAVLRVRRELILCLNLTFTFADEARDVLRRLGRMRERREVAALAQY